MTSSIETFVFRLVVRGTTADGRRIRRVRIQRSSSYEAAWADFATQEAAMAEGLTDLHHQVLPPVGWKLDGSLSVGYTA